MGELGLDAEVVGDKLFLRGKVATTERRDAIAEVVSEIAPDCELHNEVEVEALHDSDSTESL